MPQGVVMPVPCPACGWMDQVRKASAIYEEGTYEGHGHTGGVAFTDDGPAPVMARTSVFFQSDLSRRLAPPAEPILSTFWLGCGVGLTIVALLIIYIGASDGGDWRLPVGLGWICLLLAWIAFWDFADRRAAHPRVREAWLAQLDQWQRTFYCFRCDTGFTVQRQAQPPPTSLGYLGPNGPTFGSSVLTPPLLEPLIEPRDSRPMLYVDLGKITTPEGDEPTFVPQERILHDSYGIGTIESVEGSLTSPPIRILVQFDDFPFLVRSYPLGSVSGRGPGTPAPPAFVEPLPEPRDSRHVLHVGLGKVTSPDGGDPVFVLQERIMHRFYGAGTIVAIEGSLTSPPLEVLVQFDDFPFLVRLRQEYDPRDEEETATSE